MSINSMSIIKLRHHTFSHYGVMLDASQRYNSPSFSASPIYLFTLSKCLFSKCQLSTWHDLPNLGEVLPKSYEQSDHMQKRVPIVSPHLFMVVFRCEIPIIAHHIKAAAQNMSIVLHDIPLFVNRDHIWTNAFTFTPWMITTRSHCKRMMQPIHTRQKIEPCQANTNPTMALIPLSNGTLQH